MIKAILLILCHVIYAQGNTPHYHLNDYGCWNDLESDRAVPIIKDISELFEKDVHEGIQECAKMAFEMELDMMCVQDGKWCLGSTEARDTFWKHGLSDKCHATGKGGPLANHCYEINLVWHPRFSGEGCFKDDKDDPAMPSLEGSSAQLDNLNGNHLRREDAIRKCARLAASRHTLNNPMRMFGITEMGLCLGGVAPYTYNKHGSSEKCSVQGKGGVLANNVYKIVGFRNIKIESMGCFKDERGSPAIPFAEFHNFELMGIYFIREDAIGKCARYAFDSGFKYFALQNGGLCATSIDAAKNFDTYGQSDACKADGKGGEMASQVYRIIK